MFVSFVYKMTNRWIQHREFCRFFQNCLDFAVLLVYYVKRIMRGSGLCENPENLQSALADIIVHYKKEVEQYG